MTSKNHRNDINSWEMSFSPTPSQMEPWWTPELEGDVLLGAALPQQEV